MPEAVVDRLEPVEVDVQDGQRPGLSGRELVPEVGHQNLTIGQTYQIIMVGEVSKLLLSGDASLDLSEQGRDRLERLRYFRLPSPRTVFGEARRAGDHPAGHQGSHGDQRRRGLPTNGASILIVGLQL